MDDFLQWYSSTLCLAPKHKKSENFLFQSVVTHAAFGRRPKLINVHKHYFA